MMGILDQLSSQVGDRTEAANIQVAERCLAEPDLLVEIEQGLHSQDAALAGDCAEVMTKVAERQPGHVAPYALSLAPLLSHQKTRARWEAAHAVSLVASQAPEVIASLLPQLRDILYNDKSTIVRDYATEILGGYAMTGKQAAQDAYLLLREAASVYDGKHAARALNGMLNVVDNAPELIAEVHALSQQYLNHDRGVVRKAARLLSKATGSR